MVAQKGDHSYKISIINYWFCWYVWFSFKSAWRALSDKLSAWTINAAKLMLSGLEIFDGTGIEKDFVICCPAVVFSVIGSPNKSVKLSLNTWTFQSWRIIIFY